MVQNLLETFLRLDELVLRKHQEHIRERYAFADFFVEQSLLIQSIELFLADTDTLVVQLVQQVIQFR